MKIRNSLGCLIKIHIQNYQPKQTLNKIKHQNNKQKWISNQTKIKPCHKTLNQLN